MNNNRCLDLNHMPQIPEADFSVLNSHVISTHCTGIETESLCPNLCVFVCHSSVVWSTRILPNGFYHPICSENHPVVRWPCISRWYISNPVICELYMDRCLSEFCLSRANAHGNMALTMTIWRSQLPSHGAQMNLITTSTILIWLIHRVDRSPLLFL